MILYKYRAMADDSCRYSEDILRNQRFYVPKASELNDPNEGVMVVDVKNEWRWYANWLELRNRQNGVRLCSFSASSRNTVLWSHYADQHSGICIEFDSDRLKLSDGILSKVNYAKKVPEVPHREMKEYAGAFLSKSDDWAYEEEWRYVTTEGKPFLEFEPDCIKRILLGWRISKSNERAIEGWVSDNSPSSQIPLVRMKFKTLEYALYEENELGLEHARFQTHAAD